MEKKGSKGEEKLLSIPDLSAPGHMEITLSAAAFVAKNKSAAMSAEARAGHGLCVKSHICQTCPCLKDVTQC